MQLSALLLVAAPLTGALRMGLPATAPMRTTAVSMVDRTAKIPIKCAPLPTCALAPRLERAISSA